MFNSGQESFWTSVHRKVQNVGKYFTSCTCCMTSKRNESIQGSARLVTCIFQYSARDNLELY